LLVEAVARARVPRLGRTVRSPSCCMTRPEYVIGDMISPFKAVIGDIYKAVEARLLTAIHLRFGLPAARISDTAELIKAADHGAPTLKPPKLAGFAEPRRGAFRAAAEAFRLLWSATISRHGRPRPQNGAIATATALARA